MTTKYTWTDEQITFIQAYFSSMTAKQMAHALGLKVHSVRMKYYELGFKKMEMEYWDEDQLAFLNNNYKEIGDMEIAELFNALCPKQKPWTLKHIEKKRNYLGLKRTPAELKAIHQRNKENGCFKDCPRSRWRKMGVMAEGTIRLWRHGKSQRLIPYIKVEGKYTMWAPYAWVQKYGPVPAGHNVVYKVYREDLATLTDLHNLELLSDGELSKRNAVASSQGLSDGYIAGILTHGKPSLRKMVQEEKGMIEIKRQQLLLNRTIKQVQYGN